MNCKASERKGFMTLKLDMSKVYDKVEWKFIERAIFHIGFS